jgi:hypothetical protein
LRKLRTLEFQAAFGRPFFHSLGKGMRARAAFQTTVGLIAATITAMMI